MAKSKKKDHWYDVDEASVVAGVKGFQMPIGGKGKKKKNNPSKPYGEKDIYKEILEELDEEIEERIEKRGNEWVVIDPRTGATHGGSGSRDQARALQKQLGITVPRGKTGSQTSNTSSEPGYKAAEKKKGTVKQRKPPKTARVEALKHFFKKTLKGSGLRLVEASMIDYMFEDAVTPSVNLWETAIQKLPRDVVMSDKKLSEILRGMAKAEARTLAKSVVEIKRVLESTGRFLVEREKADRDPETGDIRMPFKVKIAPGEDGSGKDLLFGVRLEGSKPVVLFPEESRKELNEMLTTESKLLRAELMHVQETVLDKLEDVIRESERRDQYLNEMHSRLHEALCGYNLIETVILKNLIREKLKGVKK